MFGAGPLRPAPRRNRQGRGAMTAATQTLGSDIPSPKPQGWSAAQKWGVILVLPYLAVFALFVVYPVIYAFWLANDPKSYVKLSEDPIFWRSVINTIVFLFVAINLKMIVAIMLSGFFTIQRWWIKALTVLFILPWAVPSIPTILSVRFMLNPEWGVINQTIFKLTADDGPNWLNDPKLALFFAILVHIWKSLPFWTLILLSGRLAISKDLYEAASVDGASRWQKFRFVTWPSISQLYLTCLLLSTIWSLGDFNSVYLLTGGGPADLTHVLATLGIRYLRLGDVDLSMATIVAALPLILPLVYFMMKRLSR
jgi:multiple sugar transport system permease protein